MRVRAKAFQISFVFHSLLLVAALGLSTQMGASKKIMVLDFNLYKPEPLVKTVAPLPSNPLPRKNEMKTSQAQRLTKNDPPEQVEKPEAAFPVDIPPAVKLPEVQSMEGPSLGLGMIAGPRSVQDGSPGIPGRVKDGTGTGRGTGQVTGGGENPGSDGRTEAAKARYLKEHFAYIRDKILKNISYPTLARRMGWQGLVQLSFIIASDGSVKDIRIIQSSGFEVLDRKAVETVKETAPFPKPPAEARLVIPITFRLE